MGSNASIHAFEQSKLDAVGSSPPSLAGEEYVARTLLNATTDGALLFTPEGTILAVNYAVIRDLKRPRSDLLGTLLFDLYPSDVAAVRRAQVATVISTKQAVHFESIRDSSCYETRITPITSEDGSEVELVALFAHNITARKDAERELQNSRDELRLLSSQLERSREDERRRLARELHDSIGQSLTAIGINLGAIKERLTPCLDEAVVDHLEDALCLVQRMTRDIRSINAGLRSPVLADYGLAAALRHHASQIASRSGVDIQVIGQEPCPRLPRHWEENLFRIAQEALTNVVKHAQATWARVEIESTEKFVRLTIEDNGEGLRTPIGEAAQRKGGWGLIIIRERAISMGGKCQVKSLPECGTQVTVELQR